MDVVEGVVLVASTLAMGLMAGVFAIYANAIMPGLGRTEDRTFVSAFQAIDGAIINPAFLLSFVGALVLTGLAALLQIGEPPLPWIAAAFVLYLAGFAITVVVNVPLNDAIKAAGSAGDPAIVRERFDEPRWVRWNLVRALATTLAFGCLAWALVEFGRNL